MENKHYSTYAQKPTKRRHTLRKWQILTLVVAVSICTILISDTLTARSLKADASNVEVNFKKEVSVEPDMYEYVIGEIKKNNIDLGEFMRLMACENPKWNPEAVHVNSDHSLDVGLLQLNHKWHPEISLADKLDYKKNLAFAIGLYKKSNSWQKWACYKK